MVVLLMPNYSLAGVSAACSRPDTACKDYTDPNVGGGLLPIAVYQSPIN
ncbi:hypothetical protein C4K00_3104 [Pseudomonas synxantha]|nr:hypothetical protein C4K00_3104 [Pseudomonas synxantha]